MNKETSISGAARLIAHHPDLRADYFVDPDRVLKLTFKRYVPEADGRLSSADRRALRARLAAEVERNIDQDPRLISARETYFERKAFLTEALRNPQRSFNAIYALSIAAFGMGVLFLVAALVAAFDDKAEIAGLFGAGSIVSILGTILTLTRNSIRQANSDNAQIRLILTDFATELTHYRAIPIKSFDDAKKTNIEIRRAMTVAVMRLQTSAEPSDVPVPAEREASGGAEDDSTANPSHTGLRDGNTGK